MGYNAAHVFNKTNFIFRTSGYQDLIITNERWGVSAQIKDIRVMPSIPTGFAFNVAGYTQTAGKSFILNVTDFTDSFGNPRDGTVLVSSPTPGLQAPNGVLPVFNNIEVVNGIGNNNQILVRTINTRIIAVISNYSITNEIILSVKPAEADSFLLSGYQTICTAQTRWSPQTSVTLVVYDKFENIKTDYTNSVYFISTDPMAMFPYSNSNPYAFLLSDRGTNIMNGPDFVFYTKGNHYLTIRDSSGLSETSSVILVRSGTILSYNTIISSYTQKAGISFKVRITNARDNNNNLADGTISVTNIGTLLTAPNGNTPLYNVINVFNGAGESMQTIFKATNILLKTTVIQSNAITNIIGPVTILPGELNRIDMLGQQSICTAGIPWNNTTSITLKLFDTFENIKTDYTNEIYFTSTDPGAIVAYSNAQPYKFQLLDAGTKIINGTNFIFKQKGIQKLFVTENSKGLSDTSDNIYVDPNIVSSFNIFIDSNIKVAGEALFISITNAKDDYGNLVDSIFSVTNIAGGGASPGGQWPVFNSISVVNGSGFAPQIFYNAVNTVLKIEDLSSGVTNITPVIKIVPGPASGPITLAPVPTQTNADGVSVSLVTTSTIRDQYSNIATNGKLASVSTTFGIITNTDLSALPGIQISVNNGIVQFGLRSFTPGVSFVNLGIDSASGYTNITFHGIQLLDITVLVPETSAGQNNVPIQFTILNTSSAPALNCSISLSFSPANTNIKGTISILTNIPASSTIILIFPVDIGINVPAGNYIVDGSFSGALNGNIVSYSGVTNTGVLTIQTPGNLVIEQIDIQNPVIVGHNFPVLIRVRNIGQATVSNVHPTNLQINSTNAVYVFDPQSYSPKNITLASNQSVDFLYTFMPTGTINQVEFWVSAFGVEGNTGNPIYTAVTNAGAEVTSVYGVRLRLSAQSLSPVTVVKGQEHVIMYQLDFYNPMTVSAANIVKIRNLRFKAEGHDNAGIIPDDAIKRIQVYDNNKTYMDTTQIPSSGNILDLALATNNYIILQPQQTTRFYISIDIADNASAETFQLNIVDSSYITAQLADFTNILIQEIVDSRGDNIDNLRSDPVVIKNNNFNDVIGNYPNPFNPGNECTSIEYYMPASGTVTVKIYTLTGYLVNVLQDNIDAEAGVNTVEWCGRNGEGKIVRNGIYLAVIEAKTSKGDFQGVVKIAVIK